ncbi:hypothetical protein PAMP_012976 [Pampus punctatissimus]
MRDDNRRQKALGGGGFRCCDTFCPPLGLNGNMRQNVRPLNEHRTSELWSGSGDQYVWKQTNNPALPGRLFPFSRPPLGALTADVHNRINKQRFSRVNTGHNQQRRIYNAKN